MGDAEDRDRLLDSTQYLLDAPIPAPIIDSSDDEVIRMVPRPSSV